MLFLDINCKIIEPRKKGIIINIILLLVGFLLLIKGADWFVGGASSLATKLGIPSVVIGLTIVAFGTSAPEASVSIFAALGGSNDIAISNVIGSNIFNLAVVLGISSVIKNLPVTKSIVNRDFPFVILVSILLLVFCFTGNKISHIEGLLLLVLIIYYVYSMIKIAMSQKIVEENQKALSLPKSFALLLVGLVGIIIGGDLVVNSAKAIALSLGMSEKLVGLTIVSIGTSLPELVTSIVACRKGQVDIAVGNVVGSNIFNILFILGASATITPIGVQPILLIDGIIMIAVTVLCYVFSLRGQNVSRKEGLILLAIFIAYMAYIIARN